MNQRRQREGAAAADERESRVPRATRDVCARNGRDGLLSHG